MAHAFGSRELCVPTACHFEVQGAWFVHGKIAWHFPLHNVQGLLFYPSRLESHQIKTMVVRRRGNENGECRNEHRANTNWRNTSFEHDGRVSELLPIVC